MINTDEFRKRARDWSIPDGVIRNDVDILCDELDRVIKERDLIEHKMLLTLAEKSYKQLTREEIDRK